MPLDKLHEGPFARTDESSQEIDVVYVIAADDGRSYELCHSNLLPSDSKDAHMWSDHKICPLCN